MKTNAGNDNHTGAALELAREHLRLAVICATTGCPVCLAGAVYYRDLVAELEAREPGTHLARRPLNQAT